MKKYDLIVIGAGAGGLNSAFAAVKKNKNVLLIEKHKPGGECTWFGCIPSKAIIQIAKDIQTVNKYVRYNTDSVTVMNKVRKLVEVTHQHEAVSVLENAGINYYNGYAKIIDAHTVLVDDRMFKAENIVVTTGSRPMIPPIKGIKTVNYLTNETFFSQHDLPETLIILGGGPIGLELAQAVQRLGTKVIIVEMMNQILIREESKVSAILKSKLEEEGVEIYTSSKAVEVSETNGIISLVIENKDVRKTIKADRILLALGRIANTEGFGLEDLGIRLNNGSIEINEKYQTSVPSIYAIGDVVGSYQFSHSAGFQARQLIDYLFESKTPEHVTEDNIIWTTFTDPEIARLGLTEQMARDRYGDTIKVVEVEYHELDRATVDDKTDGFAKIICDSNYFILGATIMGERASEVLGELQLAKHNNIPLTSIDKIMHSYPSYSELIHALANKLR